MDTITIIFAFAIIGLLIFVFIRISLNIRKGGGSMYSLYSGATYEILTQDQRKAAEIIVDMNADKEMEVQSDADDDREKKFLLPTDSTEMH